MIPHTHWELAEDIQQRHLALNISTDVGKWVLEGVSHPCLGSQMGNVGWTMGLDDFAEEVIIAYILMEEDDTQLVQLIGTVLLKLDIIVVIKIVHANHHIVLVFSQYLSQVEPYEASCPSYQNPLRTATLGWGLRGRSYQREEGG